MNKNDIADNEKTMPEHPEFLYDIFLGGPFVKHNPYDFYKQKIKDAFPGYRIFDPEVQDYQKTGDWFVGNAFALRGSLALAAYLPEFPFPTIGPEAGMFYTMHNKGDFSRPLEQIVIIWPESLKPDYAKKAVAKMGYVVETPEQAIVLLKKVLPEIKNIKEF
jgi:hypothetical protein